VDTLLSVPERETEAAAQSNTPFAKWLDSIVPAVYPSDAALARELGLAQSNVTRWRRGTVPQVPALRKLARVTGTSIDLLLKVAGYEEDQQ